MEKLNSYNYIFYPYYNWASQQKNEVGCHVKICLLAEYIVPYAFLKLRKFLPLNSFLYR